MTERATGTVLLERAVFGLVSETDVTANRDGCAYDPNAGSRHVDAGAGQSGRLTPAQPCVGADQHQCPVLVRHLIDQPLDLGLDAERPGNDGVPRTAAVDRTVAEQIFHGIHAL